MQLTLGYLALAVALSMLTPLLGGFSAAIVLAVYVAWLHFCVLELTGAGRWSTQWAVRSVALPLLWGWALVALPVLVDERLQRFSLSGELVSGVSAVFAVAVLMVADDIAVAVARGASAPLQRALIYFGAVICVFGGPVAVLLLHSRVVAVGTGRQEEGEQSSASD